MRKSFLTLWSCLLLGAALNGTAAVRESNVAVPDVIGAFRNLNHHGDPMAFNMGAGASLAAGIPDDTTETHYQGIQRWQALGFDAPYLFVTRSGISDTDRANFMVVRMGSREPFGERMRSNRLVPGLGVNDTPAPLSDAVVRSVSLTDFHHAGGIQLAGDILAVPLEGPASCSDCETGMIAFFNVSTPTNPVQLSYTLPISSHKAGVIGLAKLPEPDGHFLLVLAWGKNEKLEFYRSTQKSFFDAGFSFQKHDEWNADELIGGTWVSGTAACYQSLSLVNQSDGAIYMIGARNTSIGAPLLNGDDELALFRIEGWQGGTSTTNISVTFVAGEDHKYCSSAGTPAHPVRGADGSVNADFLAASGSYVSPTGELLFYAAEHWNDGPNRSVRMVEFRNQAMLRPGNPGWEKQADTGANMDKIYVGEGSQIILDGSRSRPAVAKPWIELFNDPDFDDKSVVIDWPDRSRDDFNDFRQIASANDSASSVRWWAPPGWIIQLYNQDHWGTDESILPLLATGSIQAIRDLKDVGFDDRVTSVQFLPPVNTTVDAPLTFSWSLVNPPLNGGVLSNATSIRPLFLAGNGPNNIFVDLTIGPSPTNTAHTEIIVTNVAPVFSGISITPSSTQTGRIDVAVDFIDPGPTDTHTLRIDWGDMTSTLIGSNTPVRRFVASHVYSDNDPLATNSRTFTVSLRLRDIDGAEAVSNRAVTVVFYDGSSLADLDGDGLPDTWEDFYFGSRGFDGSGDNDGDGASNAAEYLAGTDPLDGSEFLALAIRPAGTNHCLSFAGRPAGGMGYGTRHRYYTIECATNLLAGQWRPIGALNNVPAQGDVLEALQPGQQPMRFYRLRASFNVIPAIANLKFWWRGEDSGIDLVGGLQRTNSGTYTNGIVGRAFSFDGKTHEADANTQAQASAPWTLSLWICRYDASDPSAALLMDSQYALKAEQFGTARRVGFTRFGVADYAFNYTAEAKTWTHLVFVCSPTEMALFVNGVRQDTVNASIPLPLQKLGGGEGNHFAGQLDEIEVYTRALTAAEVNSLYQIESNR